MPEQVESHYRTTALAYLLDNLKERYREDRLEGKDPIKERVNKQECTAEQLEEFIALVEKEMVPSFAMS